MADYRIDEGGRLVLKRWPNALYVVPIRTHTAILDMVTGERLSYTNAKKLLDLLWQRNLEILSDHGIIFED